MTDNEEASAAPRLHPKCALCGTDKELVKDRHNEGIFYCHTCYHRSQEHEFLIKALGMHGEEVAGD